MGDLQSKDEEIEKLQDLEIYTMLDGDSNSWERYLTLRDGYKPIKNISLINDTIESQMMFLCLRLTGNIFEAQKIYNEMDLLEIWELLTYKLAYEYQDPTYDIDQAMKSLKGK